MASKSPYQDLIGLLLEENGAQAHNIPWSLLASNLEWKTPTNFATNLYPRMEPTQAKDLTHFVNAFVKNLEDHSVCERKKYPKHYDAP